MFLLGEFGGINEAARKRNLDFDPYSSLLLGKLTSGGLAFTLALE